MLLERSSTAWDVRAVSEPTHPHDSLFKLVFADTASGAAMLRAVLPEPLAQRVDFASLTLRSGSFKDRDLAGLESDLIFSANVDGREALFYFLLEHQSSMDPTMAWRLWRYVTRIWEWYVRDSEPPLRLPLVVPIVVYHGSRPWNAVRSVAELIDVDTTLADEISDLVPNLGYVLEDLMALDPAALRAKSLPAFATVALWALRTASDRGFAETASDLTDLFDAVRQAPDGRGALWTIFSYLSAISGTDEDLVGVVAGQLSAPVREDVMDLVEHFAQQKKEEGRVEGRRGLLVKLLTLKFGPPSAEVEARIAAASLEETDRWAERILTAAAIEEVFGGGEDA